jgi:hypothetical protein
MVAELSSAMQNPAEGTPFFINIDNCVGWQCDLVFNVQFDSERERIQKL